MFEDEKTNVTEVSPPNRRGSVQQLLTKIAAEVVLSSKGTNCLFYNTSQQQNCQCRYFGKQSDVVRHTIWQPTNHETFFSPSLFSDNPLFAL
jgi:hypothetical protein